MDTSKTYMFSANHARINKIPALYGTQVMKYVKGKSGVFEMTGLFTPEPWDVIKASEPFMTDTLDIVGDKEEKLLQKVRIFILRDPEYRCTEEDHYFSYPNPLDYMVKELTGESLENFEKKLQKLKVKEVRKTFNF